MQGELLSAIVHAHSIRNAMCQKMAPTGGTCHFLAGFFLSCVPSIRDIFDKICGLGMALPLSYSWITFGFSLICCASCAWVKPFAVLAAMICFLSSPDTLQHDMQPQVVHFRPEAP